MTADTRDEAARCAARALFADDECAIADDARVSHLDESGTADDEGAAWVACWRFVPAAAIEAEVPA